MRANAWTMTLAAAVTALSWVGSARAQCQSDAQCKGERQCVDGRCTTACATDVDCPGDTVCESRTCVAPGRSTGADAAPPGEAAAPEVVAAPAALPGDDTAHDTDVVPEPLAEEPSVPRPVRSGRAVPSPRARAVVVERYRRPHRRAQPPPGYGLTTADAPPRYERRSKGAMVTGIVMLSTGAVGFAGGLVLTLAALEQEDGSSCRRMPTYDSTYYDYSCDSSWDYGNDGLEQQKAVGGVMMGLGGAFLVAGAILTPIGARKVPVDARAAGITELRVRPLVGPLSGGLAISF